MYNDLSYYEIKPLFGPCLHFPGFIIITSDTCIYVFKKVYPANHIEKRMLTFQVDKIFHVIRLESDLHLTYPYEICVLHSDT